MSVSREDGIRVDLSDELETLTPGRQPGDLTPRDPAAPPVSPIVPGSPIPLGSSIPLGEVGAGETQEVRFTVSNAGSGGPARLYFRASAWNAKGASAPVDVAPGGTVGSGTVRRPANDDFAAASVIKSEKGFRTVDLLLATPEPGEPLFGDLEGRPAGSVWYRWTAPADGAVRFNLHPPGELGGERDDRVDVFRGDAIAGLERVASDQWGALFFADEGETYRVRLSHMRRGTAVDLRWSQGDRPVNDDFGHAAVVEGDEGAVQGTSQGATLERGVVASCSGTAGIASVRAHALSPALVFDPGLERTSPPAGLRSPVRALEVSRCWLRLRPRVRRWQTFAGLPEKSGGQSQPRVHVQVPPRRPAARQFHQSRNGDHGAVVRTKGYRRHGDVNV